MKLDFLQDYTLENDFALLRPLQTTDFQYLEHFPEQEPNMWQYSVKPIAGKEGLKEYIACALEARAAGQEYPFIVWDKKQGKYAGCTRLYDIQFEHETVQLGYTWYGQEFRGTGLNKNCKFLLLQFAFEHVGAARVEFRADHRNQRSIAAMKSLGCVEEGFLRSHLLKLNGERRTSIILSILKDEWENGVKENLRKKIA